MTGVKNVKSDIKCDKCNNTGQMWQNITNLAK